VAAIAIVLAYRFAFRSALVTDTEAREPGRLSRLTSTEALAVAQQHGAAGRYREACHFVLLATLLWLEEKSFARFDPSATNREHLQRLAAQPAVASALEPVVDRFDGLWYRSDEATAEDFRALLELAERTRRVAV